MDAACRHCATADSQISRLLSQYERGILLTGEAATENVHVCQDSMAAHDQELRDQGRDAPKRLWNDYGDVLAEGWSWHFEEWLRGLMLTLGDSELSVRVRRGLGRNSEWTTEYAIEVAAFDQLCERAGHGDSTALAAARSIVSGDEHAWRAHSLVDHDAYAVALAAFPVDWPPERRWHPCGWPKHVSRHYYPFVHPILRWLARAARDGADEPYHHLLALLAREEAGLHTFVVDLLPLRDPGAELEVLRRRMDRGMLGQSELRKRLDEAIERLGGSAPPRRSS